MGAVLFCDLVESGWMDEKAREVLGLPDEVPDGVPDYMPREEVDPTEENSG